MSSTPPRIIAIDHDDYHAEYIGRTTDGRQFFLTNSFVPATDGSPGNEFVTLYLFDDAGRLLETKIDSFGPRAELDRTKRLECRDRHLRELGEVSFQRIEVAPFAVERFGLTFGLIARPPEEEGDSWWVELQPGNYMAFHEPWDSGEYDT